MKEFKLNTILDSEFGSLDTVERKAFDFMVQYEIIQNRITTINEGNNNQYIKFLNAIKKSSTENTAIEAISTTNSILEILK